MSFIPCKFLLNYFLYEKNSFKIPLFTKTNAFKIPLFFSNAYWEACNCFLPLCVCRLDHQRNWYWPENVAQYLTKYVFIETVIPFCSGVVFFVPCGMPTLSLGEMWCDLVSPHWRNKGTTQLRLLSLTLLHEKAQSGHKICNFGQHDDAQYEMFNAFNEEEYIYMHMKSMGGRLRLEWINVINYTTYI